MAVSKNSPALDEPPTRARRAVAAASATKRATTAAVRPAKPAAKSAAKPAAKPAAKAAPKSAAKPASKTATKAAANTTTKAAAGTATKAPGKATKAAAGKPAKKAAAAAPGEVATEAPVEAVEVEVDEEVEEGAEFTWDDEEESEALRQARKDAEMTASADSVRAYLKQIGKVALLNAEEEVDLAKRIEAGLYAAERLRQAEEANEKLALQARRDLRWIVRDGERAKNHLLEIGRASCRERV